jgi:hypothetical protein
VNALLLVLLAVFGAVGVEQALEGLVAAARRR